MIRTPDASHTLIDTLHRLRDPLILLPARISQQLRLLQNLVLLQIPHADRLLAPIDVVSDYDGVFAWSRRDYHLD